VPGGLPHVRRGGRAAPPRRLGALLPRGHRGTLIDRNVSREEPTTSPQLRVDAGRDAERLLSKLPEEWRTVVVLNVVEGWTAEEIAASLGVSPNTVFTRLYRARQRIKELTEGTSA
jgi:RNA polymerase sigma factor (sigma-70 family)